MKAQKACLECLKRQTEHFLTLQGHLSDSVNVWERELCEQILPSYGDTELCPTQIAIEVYEKLARFMDCHDPFLSIKQESMQKAQLICTQLLDAYPAPEYNAKGLDSMYRRLAGMKYENTIWRIF